MTVEEAKVEVGAVKISSATAKKADTIELTFANAVDTADVDVEVSLSTSKVDVTTTWNDAKTVATVTSKNNFAAGTYTVKATSKKDKNNTDSTTVKFEKQKVSEIKFLNTVALTGSKQISGVDTKSMKAYVYYDVLDQYGESMRTSTSLQWSSSVKITEKNTNLGRLTLERTDAKAFTYNEQVYVTGVHTATGVSNTGTFTIGQEQAVNSVALAGFVKKGTTTIRKDLPADFKSDAYYMLYNVKDQNDNVIEAGSRINGTQGDVILPNPSATPAVAGEIKDITFIADNVMVISEIKTPGNTLTIDGTDYDTVLVKPGIKVEDGGEVTVTAIASKTGNKSSIVVPVNLGTVITNFEIGGVKGGVLADGETVELEYTATDAKGNKITDFETIAKQETFNKLQLTASTGTLALRQNDDGSARLEYSDNTENTAWSESKTTDGQDRIASLNAIVVGGSSNNTTLYITDKARPVGIKDVNLGAAYLEGTGTNFELTRTGRWDGNAYFTYVDQYGRQICCNSALAFFAASYSGTMSGTDFSNYRYGVEITYTGAGKSSVAGIDAEKKVVIDSANPTAAMTALKNVSATATESIKASVVRIKLNSGVPATGDDKEKSAVSKSYSKNYEVIDISKVSSLKIKDIAKIYTNTVNSDADYLENSTVTTGTAIAAGTPIVAGYDDNKVEVEGTYKGASIGVPADYFTVTSDIIAATRVGNDYKINTVTGSGVAWTNIYNYTATTDRYARKDGQDKFTVVVSRIAGDADGAGVISTLKKTFAFSDEAPRATTLTANVKERTITPTLTVLTTVLGGWNQKLVRTDNNACDKGHHYYWDAMFSLKDQYGKDFEKLDGNGIVYEIRDVKEADAYADNNFTINNNATAVTVVKDASGNEISASGINVVGAERGDKFTLVASFGTLPAVSIPVTVGADVRANIENDNNNYLKVLIDKDGATSTPTTGNGLELQRLNGLK